MGVAVDVYGTDAEVVADRLAAGIRPWLEGVRVAVERELSSAPTR